MLELRDLRLILPDMAGPVPARLQTWAWFAIAAVAAALVYLLSPILAPFLFAAVLAYILDPLVERLAARRIPRALAVLLVLLLAVGALLALRTDPGRAFVLARAIEAPTLEVLGRTIVEQAPKQPQQNLAACEDGYRWADAQLQRSAA